MGIYLGIDLGTSSVKLLLMDAEGKIIKSVSKTYPIYLPKPLWSEQNPNDWWRAVRDGILELGDYRGLIEGISFCGQMHGLVILDEYDEVIRPAILWNDQRTQEECDFLNNDIGRDIVSYCTGNIALTGFTAPKLLWLKKKEPLNYKRIDKIMLPKDYIAYKLSGVFATDVSDASGTLYFDVKNRCWSADMINIIGIERYMLPNVFESYQNIGIIKGDISKELGLNKNTKVIIGGGDQAVGAVGTGTVDQNQCSISLGTSGVVFVSTERFCEDKGNNLHSFCHANGRYHLMGVILSAAGALEWWVKSICCNEYENVLARIKEVKIDEDIFFLPYLMGERTPINNPKARGVFMGMTLNQKQEDMTLAVLEGVTFALRDSFEIIKELGINVNEVKVTGGGSKSTLWLHILADILGVKVCTINTTDGPALGAAILASVGCGKYKTVEEACKNIIKVEKIIYCNRENFKKYDIKYKKYKEIYPAVKHLF